jgi:hypothetical protein
MNSATSTVAEIATELFLRLEQREFRYAVLRNYERLPHLSAAAADHAVTDIDLVMHRQDLPAFRNLAVSLAADCGWDVLTECTHFCASRVPEHRIEIFRFYRLSPPACLQVDIFHGFLLWAVPFENERAMLEGRNEDPRLNLTRISRSSENAFRMLQLYSLLQDGALEEKIARYRGKVLEHYGAHDTQFRGELRRAFSTFGEQALDALIRNDLVRFQRTMRFGKAWFLGRFWLQHPVLTLRYFYERARDHSYRFMTRQCGFVLAAHAPSDRDRWLLRSALDELTKKKILPAWTTRGGEHARVTWTERQVMERGGIAVKWANAPGDFLDVTQTADCDELVASILPRLIARHQPLYGRHAARPTA